MSGNQYRQWNGAQWMVWGWRAMVARNASRTSPLSRSATRRGCSPLSPIAFFVGVMVVVTFIAADLMK